VLDQRYLLALLQSSRTLVKLVACLAFPTATVALTACAQSDRAIATTDGTKVSQATLNHWMEVALGSDYRPIFRAGFPAGLVSDPPEYARCVRVSQEIPIVPGKSRLTADQRRLKCRQLYAAIKEQALSLVLSSVWTREEAGELGIRMPTENEVDNRVRAYIAHDFTSPADFREVIAEEHRSLSDVRYMIENTLLQGRIASRLKAQAEQLGGTGQAALYKLVLENNAKRQAKTHCDPGYRAPQCRQFASGSEAKPSASLVLEYFHKGIS
jgi:hypothetical protein